jgi:hypothetical protein
VGPTKKGPDGRPLLDRFGNPQRYALAEHWYHARMCGRRAARQADSGTARATSVLRELCPWLFEKDKRATELLEEHALRTASIEGMTAEDVASVPEATDDTAARLTAAPRDD